MIDFAKSLFLSEYHTDLILGTFSGSFSVPANGSDTQVTRISIPDTVLFVGRGSTDGGISWYNLNYNGVVPGNITYTTNIQSAPGAISVGLASSIATPLTLTWQAALLAKPDQSSVTSQPIGAKSLFVTSNNYQKIFNDYIYPYSFGSTSSPIAISYVHGLGYPPRVAAWIEFNTSGTIQLFDITSLSIVPIITNTDVSFSIDPGTFVSGKIYTRVYYDA